MYNYLTGYSQKDFSPVPQLATAWVESADHKTWTYTIRSGVKWSDGVAAHRGRRRLHVQPDHQRHVRADQLRQLRHQHHQADGAGPDDRGHEGQEADPDHDPPAGPDPPRAHLEERQREGGQELHQRAKRRAPVVGSGPFVLDRAQQGPVHPASRPTPTTSRAHPKIDELVFRWFGSQEPMTQALKTRRDRHRRQPRRRRPSSRCRAAKGITTVRREVPRLRRVRVQHRRSARGRHARSATATRPSRTRPSGGASPTPSTARRWSTRSCGGYGEPGTSIIPPIFPNQHYDPGADTYDYNVAKANSLLDAAGYPKGTNGIRVDKHGKALNLRLFARSESPSSKQDRSQFVAGLAQGRRHRGQRQDRLRATR